MLGTQIDGRYRIDALIARGGMSTVYRALDTRLDRPVAIKIMDPKFAVDPQFVARFEFEARAVARLSHPGLVAVYDHGRDGEFAFLVMELVEGGTLRELLRERGPMPPHAAMAVIQPVLDALAVAHRAGLVHRDIKPENILISDSGDVKIADFGLVRAVAASTTTSSSVILGTAAYLSPEQVTVGTADAASDVFSVGVVLFELLTGRTPFTGDTSLSIAYQRIDNDVPPPSRFIVGVPPPLDELVRHATARSASERFPNADVMSKAVRNVSSQLHLPDYRVPSPRRSAEHLSAAAMGAPTTVGEPRTAEPAGTGTTTRAFSASALLSGSVKDPESGDHRTRVVTTPTSRSNDAPDGAGPPPAIRGQYQFPDFDADRKKSRRTIAIWVVIVALLAAALGIGGWWIGDGRYTSVPSIEGMDTASADATIHAAGLSVDSQESYSNDVAFRSVIGTDPPAGSRVTKDSHVSLLVSLGRPAVPPIDTETSASSMQQKLRDLTLTPVDGGSAFSSSVPAGDVVGLSPTPGTVVDVASQVKVVVSKGSPPVTIPDLTGRSENDARAALEALGITVGDTQKIYDASVDGGDVIGTDPAAGATVTAGGIATLSVSTAVTVPSLLGKSVRSAKEQLTQLGLDATVSQVFNTDGSLVISQNPRFGTRVEPGSTVSVISLP